MPSGRQTKFQRACEKLTAMAHELGPDERLPTVLQLRDQLGISVATVNLVLTELETKHVIVRRHGIGLFVAPDLIRRRVCVVCDPTFFRVHGDSPFWGILLDLMRSRGDEDRTVFSFHYAADFSEFSDPLSDIFGATDIVPLQEGLADELNNGRYDVVLGIGLSKRTEAWIQETGVPLVAFAGQRSATLGVDSREIVRLGVEALVNEGCQRIALLTPVAPYVYRDPAADEGIVRAFREALAKTNLEFDPELIQDNRHLIPQWGGAHAMGFREQGYRAAAELFGADTEPSLWPDGIVSTDERMTQGILTVLQRAGIRVGLEILVATHSCAGSPVLLGDGERMILVEIDLSEVVGELIVTLDRLMNNEDPLFDRVVVGPRVLLPDDV